MSYFPFFIDIKDKEILVIGGGTVAHRKISTLLEFGVKITVVAEKSCDGLLTLAKENKVVIINKAFEIEDLDYNNYFCVVSATDSECVNKIVADECIKNNILVNVADDIDNCNFIFPTIVKKDDIIVGITTSGKSPIMAKTIKQNVESALPEHYGELVKNLGMTREKIKSTIFKESNRKMVLQKVTKLSLENKKIISDEEVAKLVKEMSDSEVI